MILRWFGSAIPAGLVWILIYGIIMTSISSAATRLERTNLLQYHTPAGDIAPVKTEQQWLQRRSEIVAGMTTVMGPLPLRPHEARVDMEVLEERDQGTYVQRRISYSSGNGPRVPAYLLLPRRTLGGEAKLPAVLALHPTDMEYGNRVLVEGLRDYYHPYARDLAERGFVVLAPAYPLMADYQPDLKALGYVSGTMKAIDDNRRGLDLLESLPYVKKGGFGAIGHSLGGHNAIYTAVFDDRIKVLAVSCGFDSFLDYMGGDISGWTSDRYMPRLLEYRNRVREIPFDFHELIGALAPRLVFVNAPLQDSNFKAKSVDAVVGAASEVYRLYGKPENLSVVHPDCGHDFPPAAREQAYRLLGEALR